MNIHTPERGPDETREAYIARRRTSILVAKRLRKPSAPQFFVQRTSETVRREKAAR